MKIHGYHLADPDVTAGNIKLLIGADFYYNFAHSGYKRMRKTVLLPTIYGYVLSGTYQSQMEGTNVKVVTVLKLATDSVGQISRQEEIKPTLDDLSALWELDHIGTRRALSREA